MTCFDHLTSAVRVVEVKQLRCNATRDYTIAFQCKYNSVHECSCSVWHFIAHCQFLILHNSLHSISYFDLHYTRLKFTHRLFSCKRTLKLLILIEMISALQSERNSIYFCYIFVLFLNLILLLEWMQCHCVFCIIHGWNVHVVFNFSICSQKLLTCI